MGDLFLVIAIEISNLTACFPRAEAEKQLLSCRSRPTVVIATVAKQSPEDDAVAGDFLVASLLYALWVNDESGSTLASHLVDL